jgi:hypothetical protein
MSLGTATMPRKSGKIVDQSVRLDADVVQMARAIVAIKGGSMAGLISDLARPLLQETVRKMQAKGEFLPPAPPKKTQD